MLGKSKIMTLDSFWIEEELKNYLKKDLEKKSSVEE